MDAKRSEDAMDFICERLKTIDLENEKIVMEVNLVAKVMDRGNNCVLLKLLTSKYYNWEAFKVTMRL